MKKITIVINKNELEIKGSDIKIKDGFINIYDAKMISPEKSKKTKDHFGINVANVDLFTIEEYKDENTDS